jgi:hypothetical protein
MNSQLLSNRSRSVLVACALTASALLGSGVAQAETCRPWHINASAQFSDPIYDEDGNLIYGEAAGSGHASHIGAIAVVGMDYFALPEDGFVVVDGTGILTAVNGDQIWVNFDGSVFDLVTGGGTGTYVVTGGTGRFTDATGTAGFSSTFLEPNGFAIVADGTLCY